PLSNGNYVVADPLWNNGRGAVTWAKGSMPTTGAISEANSLVGSHPGDQVGYYGGIFPLTIGNYVVASPYWNGYRGAVTWGNGSTGTSGIVSEANSLAGSDPGDMGSFYGIFGIGVLSNSNYLVQSPSWNGMRGAVT